MNVLVRLRTVLILIGLLSPLAASTSETADAPSTDLRWSAENVEHLQVVVRADAPVHYRMSIHGPERSSFGLGMWVYDSASLLGGAWFLGTRGAISVQVLEPYPHTIELIEMEGEPQAATLVASGWIPATGSDVTFLLASFGPASAISLNLEAPGLVEVASGKGIGGVWLGTEDDFDGTGLHSTYVTAASLVRDISVRHRLHALFNQSSGISSVSDADVRTPSGCHMRNVHVVAQHWASRSCPSEAPRTVSDTGHTSAILISDDAGEWRFRTRLVSNPGFVFLFMVDVEPLDR